jgi:hypothetical protein
MIPEFKKLTQQEQSLLINAPVIVSILAGSTTGEISEWKKADAIKLAHLKTFSAHPLLIQYYKEVEKTFEQNFEYLVRVCSPVDDYSRKLLEIKAEKINEILEKLEPEFATTLRTSLLAYASHVKKAYKGLVFNFLFPFPIFDLTE